jgi:hypothetical protein
MTFSIMTLSIMTLSIKTLSFTTLSKSAEQKHEDIQYNDTQHNNKKSMSLYNECYGECCNFPDMWNVVMPSVVAPLVSEGDP